MVKNWNLLTSSASELQAKDASHTTARWQARQPTCASSFSLSAKNSAPRRRMTWTRISVNFLPSPGVKTARRIPEFRVRRQRIGQCLLVRIRKIKHKDKGQTDNGGRGRSNAPFSRHMPKHPSAHVPPLRSPYYLQERTRPRERETHQPRPGRNENADLNTCDSSTVLFPPLPGASRAQCSCQQAGGQAREQSGRILCRHL